MEVNSTFACSIHVQLKNTTTNYVNLTINQNFGKLGGIIIIEMIFALHTSLIMSTRCMLHTAVLFLCSFLLAKPFDHAF
jgi:hypothetical protein